MAIIKAKYNNFYRPYMRTERQGFGSLYGGNHEANVDNNNSDRNIEESHNSDFPN